ncbi:MAG: hypothetical protein E7477_09265 [Ruminococcaceae bacterium]|nr:hypothetical protein [Oscillospiraceae bacterium]
MKKVVKIDHTQKIGTPNPKMWGIFYEEINHAGDGGIYAELISNRNFADAEYPEGAFYSSGKIRTVTGFTDTFNGSKEPITPLPSWSLKKAVGSMADIERIYDDPRNPECPVQLRMMFKGKVKLVNKGYWGICAKEGGYHGFVIVKSSDICKAKVGLMRKDGSVVASSEIDGICSEYKKIDFSFTVTTPDTDTRFFIEVDGCGEVFFDFVSLMPDNAVNGIFRKDLFEMLDGMKPGFLRFPGGCVVEGITLENAIHWKKTVGPIEDRPGHWDLWGYRCTDGMGMLEFCMLGEALGADLMYVFNVGMSCQARQSESADGEALDWWIRNTLDGVEYICGDVSTKWGSKRAANGHPEPFKLKYLEIGNENWGELYWKRYTMFRDLLKEKYPDITLISNVRVPDETYDLVDDHYYTSPEVFPAMYDKYSGDGEKVYVGEYACNSNVGYGNLLSAISEATFMTHMENCCDRVRIASYAPLFCNENDRRWSVNLINFDRSGVFGLPSYYVQKLFATNPVEYVVKNDADIIKGSNSNLYVTSGVCGDELIIKVANFNPEAIATEFICDAIKEGDYELTVVSSENETDTNTVLYPRNVADSLSVEKANNGKIKTDIEAMSFNVIKVKIK